jgi:hypothetical protein
MSFNQYRTNPGQAVSSFKGRTSTPHGWPSTRVSTWLNGGLMSLGGGSWANQIVFDASVINSYFNQGGIWVDVNNNDDIYYWCRGIQNWGTGYKRSAWGRLLADGTAHTWQSTLDINSAYNVTWINTPSSLSDGTRASSADSDYIIGSGTVSISDLGSAQFIAPVVVNKSNGTLYTGKYIGGTGSTYTYLAGGQPAMSAPETSSARIIWGGRYYNPWVGPIQTWIARNNGMGGGAQAGTTNGDYAASVVFKGVSGNASAGHLYSQNTNGGYVNIHQTNNGVNDFNQTNTDTKFSTAQNSNGGYTLHPQDNSTAAYVQFGTPSNINLLCNNFGGTNIVWQKTYTHSSGNELFIDTHNNECYMHLDVTTNTILVTGRITNPGSGTAGPGNYICNYLLSINGSDGSINWSRIISFQTNGSTRRTIGSAKVAGFNGNAYMSLSATDSGARISLLKFSNETPPDPQTITFDSGDTLDIYAGNISAGSFTQTASSVGGSGNPTTTSWASINSLNHSYAAGSSSISKVKI